MVAEELNTLPTTYFKKLVGSDDIWECRVQIGSNDYRKLSTLEKVAAALGKRLRVKIA